MQAPHKSAASNSSARPQGVVVPYLGLDLDLARATTRLGDLDNLDIGRDGAGSAGHGRCTCPAWTGRTGPLYMVASL